MENMNKQGQPTHQEAVQRFCPVLQKNVVMLKRRGDFGDTFECVDHTKCASASQSCRHHARSDK